MTKGKAIQAYCRECSGFDQASHTLCHITDCPLWRHRLGCDVGTKSYASRVTGAWDYYRDAREELVKEGLTVDDMLRMPKIQKPTPRNRGVGRLSPHSKGQGEGAKLH